MLRTITAAWCAFLLIALIAVPAYVRGQTLSPTKPDPAPEIWAVSGTCVAQGNIYPDVPENRVSSATMARKQAEAAVRAVLRCMGRPESDATAIMQTVRLTGLATSGASWAGWRIAIDDRNFASVVVTKGTKQ